MQASSEPVMKRLSLELGGNAPFIVFGMARAHIVIPR
jgi:acyl-CoA reductase-like NAD-dependent aldehyde dehydrogenase